VRLGFRRSILVACISAFLIVALAAPALGNDIPSLKDIFEGKFMVGCALSRTFFLDTQLITKHFNTVTPENCMKWESIHPSPGRYTFGDADALVNFAEENGMAVIGHTLIWHQQTPEWVFKDEQGKDLTREALLERMKEHIYTVVGRYKGRVKGWDVVNEAIDDSGGVLRYSPWRRIIGDDYIEWAFRFAHEADPDAELYYNDYSTTDPVKREAIYNLVKGLLDKGLRVDGIGMQGHWDIQSPSEQSIRAAIERFSSLGVDVHITELDVSVFPWTDRSNRYASGLSESVEQLHAARYAMMFRVFQDYSDVIERVTFWGLTDRYSWKNNFPVVGRTDYPLLFDRQGNPKAAFWAVVATAEE
jgi:endo-1,4-beta-xylanase